MIREFRLGGRTLGIANDAGADNAGGFAANIPWDRVARYYDTYVTVDFDVPYFRGKALETEGPVLELMCGTGRISLPLIEAGADFCGVDLSPAFTAVLRAKLDDRGLSARIVTGDVRTLDLGQDYGLVFIGFNAFAELLGEADQRAALRAVARHLAPGGRAIVTLHNPAIRRLTLHEEWSRLGRFDLAGGGSVEIDMRYGLDDGRERVSGEQRYVERCARGTPVEEFTLPIRFELIELERFAALARSCGLRLDRVVGDYDEGLYDPSSSRFIIVELTAARR